MRRVLSLIGAPVLLSAALFLFTPVQGSNRSASIACNEAALRSALQVGGDIDLPGGCTYSLTMNLPTITADATINGNGSTLDGRNVYRLLSTFGRVNLNLKNLTLRNGYYGEGGALYMPQGNLQIADCQFSGNKAIFGNGGAIWFGGETLSVSRSQFSNNSGVWGGAVAVTAGSLFVEDSRFSANSAEETGAALFIFNAPATITRSVFTDNAADNSNEYLFEYAFGAGEGGAVYVSGDDATITNSTFSGNSSAQSGGSAAYAEKANLTVISSTIVANSASNTNNRHSPQEEGALLVDRQSENTGSGQPPDTHQLRLQQSIVANNRPLDIAPSDSFDSLGYNLIGSDSAGKLTVQKTDKVNVAPGLEPFRNDSYLLAPGSPALDAIPPDVCATHEDQRRMSRPQGAGCDIGAIEMQRTGSVAATAPATPAVSSVEAHIACTESALRRALPLGGTISFPTSCTISLTADLPDVSADLVIDGNGAILDGDGRYRLLHVTGYAKISLDKLTLRHGRGGLQAERGSVTVSDCIFSGNALPGGHGGAIYAGSADVSVTHTVFSSNTAQDGGAIYVYSGRLNVTGSTFDQNLATENGGAVWAGQGDVTVASSQFHENATRSGSGGALYADSSAVAISSSHFVRNLADRSGSGGGIFAGTGSVSVGDSQFEDNAAGSRADSISSNVVLRIQRSAFVGNGGQPRILGIIKNVYGQTPQTLDITQSTFTAFIPDVRHTIACDEPSLDEGIRLGGELDLAPGCTYTLSHDSPFIARDMSIQGNGATIDGQSNYRLLYAPGQVMLTVADITLRNGYSPTDGGAIFIGIPSTLNLASSLLIGNRALGVGGAVAGSALTITNSTLTDNSAKDGGAVSGSGRIVASTIVNNSALTGGGLRIGQIELQQTILAANHASKAPDVDMGESGSISSQSYNLLDSDVIAETPYESHYKATDIFINRPALGTFNGRYYPLLPGSPALNAIPADACATRVDMRGVARPQGPGCDIGAIEMESPNVANQAPATLAPPIFQALSCSETALANAIRAGGAYELLSTCMIHLTADLPPIQLNLTLKGNGATIDGASKYHVFSAPAYAITITLDSLNVERTTGAVITQDGNIVVTNSAFTGNTGSVISTWGGDVTLRGDVFTDTQTPEPDISAPVNVESSGTLTVEGCTFTHNQGGAIDAEGGTISISNSRFINNTRKQQGIAPGAALVIYGDAEITIYNSLFFGNTGGNTISAAPASKTKVTITASTLIGVPADGPILFVGMLRLTQSIVAYGPQPNGRQKAISVGTTFISGGYNLFDSSPGVPLLPTDMVAKPGLEGLDAQTGLVLLSAESPAQDAIPPALCATKVDIRGVKRPQGAGCDIGAVEMQPSTTETF